ncbi:hypothetical protein QYF36_013439 [Acer negundo]|nr:hypothetical protein QYF36_013439 [Acer negundo]
MGYLQYRSLIEKGLVPLKDMSYLTNGYLNTVIDWIPGMEGIRLKDLPTFIRTTDADDIKLNFAIGEVENARNASALLFNTIGDLENEVLESLSPTNPPIFTIGPLQLLLDQIPHEDALSSIKSNLWKEQVGYNEANTVGAPPAKKASSAVQLASYELRCKEWSKQRSWKPSNAVQQGSSKQSSSSPLRHTQSATQQERAKNEASSVHGSPLKHDSNAAQRGSPEQSSPTQKVMRKVVLLLKIVRSKTILVVGRQICYSIEQLLRVLISGDLRG